MGENSKQIFILNVGLKQVRKRVNINNVQIHVK